MSTYLPTPEEDPGYHRITGAIGRAITCWARVEDELANVFSQATRSLTFQSREIFYAARSFEARLDLTQASLKFWLNGSEDLKTEWTSVHNLITRKAKKRNELAHCALIRSVEDGNHKADPYCQFTGKWFTDFDSNMLLDTKQIYERAEGFVNLAVRIAVFQEHLAAHLGQHSISSLLSSYPELRPQIGVIPSQEENLTPPKLQPE